MHVCVYLSYARGLGTEDVPPPSFCRQRGWNFVRLTGSTT